MKMLKTREEVATRDEHRLEYLTLGEYKTMCTHY